MGQIIGGVRDTGSVGHENYIGIHHKVCGEGASTANRDGATGSIKCIRLRQHAGGDQPSRIIQRDVNIDTLAIILHGARAHHKQCGHVQGLCRAVYNIVGTIHDRVGRPQGGFDGYSLQGYSSQSDAA